MDIPDTSPLDDDCEVLLFGPFQLCIKNRVLREGERRVRSSPRAMEILIALAEKAGETVRKTELLERVWPGTAVQEGVLRVHIAALRKVLGDGVSGKRYIENVPGRGYRFVARVRRERGTRFEAPASSAGHSQLQDQVEDTPRAYNLPSLYTKVLGRT